ncbi:MAG TPA: aspartate aminotransferase family protein [Chthoniobacterales bacterium]|jgi:4-aminobutyrate aminotransferase-like enzyme
MLPSITTSVPGPRSVELAARLRKSESRNVTFISEGFPIFWERAEGANVWDVDGNRYLDLTSGFAVAGLGYGQPEIVAAMREQSGQLYHAMGDVHPTELKVRLCEELSAVTFERWGLGNGKTILANSGSEAVEAALKTAFIATGKRGVIAFEGAYHGLGYGALETGGLPFFRDPFRPQLGAFAHLVPFPQGTGGSSFEQPFPEADPVEMKTIERQIVDLLTREEIGCILVEPCQGRAGDIVPPREFLPLLRRLCDVHGALLILDEIYTGFNRTGQLFACDHSPAKPDLICLGKGLTSGFPLSACVGRAEVMDAWPESGGEALHTSTFLGNPLGCRMALESLRLQQDPATALLVAITAGKLRRALEGVVHPLRGRVRGIGLMLGLEVLGAGGAPNPPLMGEIILRSLRDGLILLGGGTSGHVLSFTPPFALSDEEITYTAERLQSYFDES